MKGYSDSEINRVLNTYPISSWEYPKVMLAIPLERTLSYADSVFPNFMQIAASGVDMIHFPYMRIDVVRNKIASALLASDHTHVLMLDNDHIHPVDIVQRLARHVMKDPDKLVVGGMNFRRGKPYDPCVFIRDGDRGHVSIAEWEPGLIKVDAIGTGSILISRKVFEMMEPPWFYNIYEEAWSDRWPGEDIGFCLKCNDLGINIYCDTTAQSPHCIVGTVTEGVFKTTYANTPQEQRGRYALLRRKNKDGDK